MTFVKGKQLSQEIGLSTTTFKRYRLNGVWQEGIHWRRLNPRVVLYNLPLILDWIANQSDPQAHQRAIEAYLTSLPSNQPKKRGRKAAS